MMNQLHIYFQEGGGKKPEITEKPTGFSISRKCEEIAKIYNNQSLNSKNNLIIADKTIKFHTKRFDSDGAGCYRYLLLGQIQRIIG